MVAEEQILLPGVALNAGDKAGLKIKTLAVKLIAPCYPRNEYIRRKCAARITTPEPSLTALN